MFQASHHISSLNILQTKIMMNQNFPVNFLSFTVPAL